MGYTHYWYRRQTLGTPAQFQSAANDCAKVVAVLTKRLDFVVQLGSEDDRPAAFTSELIRFNGTDDEGHEPLVVEREYGDGYRQESDDGLLFQCCKTARKPYDIAVCACLIVLRHHFPGDVRVSSDSALNDADCAWPLAIATCWYSLGYGKEFKLRE